MLPPPSFLPLGLAGLSYRRIRKFPEFSHNKINNKNIDAVQAWLNRIIKQFETWFSTNSCVVNTDKTKTMLFHLNKTCNLVIP
jgi:hypothetical protein